MDWDTLDDEQLGHAVDGWLATLRAQSLSDRRIRELTGLLGQAMSGSGPRNAAEERVLRRFDAWLRASYGESPPT